LIAAVSPEGDFGALFCVYHDWAIALIPNAIAIAVDTCRSGFGAEATVQLSPYRQPQKTGGSKPEKLATLNREFSVEPCSLKV
jgi:hypothetical protein